MTTYPMVSKGIRLVDIFGPLNEVEMHHAPEVLYLRGDESLLSTGRRVAVIGSRESSADGLARARRIVRILVEHGLVVVSGLARGIDTAAHAAAIAAGGRTIAVLGTPLDRVYPAENRPLQEEIGRDHLLVSQFKPGTRVGRAAFPQRNRTMALLSDATVIVEAGDGSGTLHQGWEALRLGRPLFIMRAVAENPRLAWPKDMLSYGAEVLAEAEDLLAAVPAGRRDFVLDAAAPA